MNILGCHLLGLSLKITWFTFRRTQWYCRVDGHNDSMRRMLKPLQSPEECEWQNAPLRCSRKSMAVSVSLIILWLKHNHLPLVHNISREGSLESC